MSSSANDNERRLAKPYKEHLRETLKTAEDYIGYLNACHDEGPETFALAVQDVLEFRATSMRSLCVEKMKGLWTTRRGNDYNGALNDALREIESLTLDQVEQKR